MDYLRQCDVNNIQEIIDEKEDFFDGDLCLMIACTKCDAQYELNKEAVAWSVLGNATFWDFVRFVQH